jgi:hypothetical protein
MLRSGGVWNFKVFEFRYEYENGIYVCMYIVTVRNVSGFKIRGEGGMI